jgi:hypothetical protein
MKRNIHTVNLPLRSSSGGPAQMLDATDIHVFNPPTRLAQKMRMGGNIRVVPGVPLPRCHPPNQSRRLESVHRPIHAEHGQGRHLHARGMEERLNIRVVKSRRQVVVDSPALTRQPQPCCMAL